MWRGEKKRLQKSEEGKESFFCILWKVGQSLISGLPAFDVLETPQWEDCCSMAHKSSTNSVCTAPMSSLSKSLLCRCISCIPACGAYRSHAGNRRGFKRGRLKMLVTISTPLWGKGRWGIKDLVFSVFQNLSSIWSECLRVHVVTGPLLGSSTSGI